LRPDRYSPPMQRHRDGDLSDLVRNTIIWTAVVIWLLWGYVIQTPPGGPYSDAVRTVFTAILAIVTPVVSTVLLVAWVNAFSDRPRG
jgi:hypothetical protein